MKKFILFLSCIAISAISLAQGELTRRSFLDGNPVWAFRSEFMPKVWEKNCYLDIDDKTYTYYFVGGEKEIEGTTYKMMGKIVMKDGVPTITMWLPVREEEGVVYARTESLPGLLYGEYFVSEEWTYLPYIQKGSECVLYNFNLQPGDNVSPDGRYKVTSMGTCQLLDETECRVWHMDTQGIYEVVGSLNNPMDPLYFLPIPTNGNIYASTLNVYYRDGKMLYKAPEAEEGLCIDDTCWSSADAYRYAGAYKEDPYVEQVMSMIHSSITPGKGPYDFEADGIYYKVLSEAEGTCAVTYKEEENFIEPYHSPYQGKVVVPEAVVYGGKTYRTTRIGEDSFHDCGQLTSVVLPEGIEEIGKNAFNGCGQRLEQITLPGSVTKIEEMAFGWYSPGISVTNLATTPQKISIAVFGTEHLADLATATLHVLPGCREAYAQAEGWKEFKNIVEDAEVPTAISHIPSPASSTLYDLQGRKIEAKPGKGIYIKDGKKYGMK